MSERNRRSSGRDREEARGARASSERRYGQDEPRREERRSRYPDENYGGERERQFSGGDRYRDESRDAWDSNQGWRAEGTRTGRREFGPERYGEEPPQAQGHGYGYGFSDSGDYRPERPSGGRSWDNYPRADDRGWGGRDMSGEPGSWDRNRAGGYAGGSAGSNQGASFGFGPAENPGRGGNPAYGSYYGQGDMNSGRMGTGRFQDTDWVPNRPARGRGTWAGDWADSTGSGSEWTPGRVSGGYGEAPQTGRGENYMGRGPKDYRRSDDRIREEICDIFTDDANLDPSDVVIKVESAEVTLMGSVSSRDQKRRAEEMAERVSGVRDVINQLRVSRGETTTGAAQTQQQTSSRSTRGSSSQQQAGVAADRENR